MAETVEMKIIARLHSDFATKFGVPRQSGLVDALRATVVFEPEYRNPDALRGLADFSRIWLVWQFSQAVRASYSPTVRPPRLGGNTRMGVFATRSPFRPNAIGLSCVGLAGIDLHAPNGPILQVTGADLMDGTPIFDIKPYLPYADAYPDAAAGFTAGVARQLLQVDFAPALLARLPAEKQAAAIGVLANDPRPPYQNDPTRVYGFTFAGFELRFTVAGEVLTVVDCVPATV
ncbi:MAG: tRNA (N6-threonylcarbamoyladenosine(37)-N6)-methyltransferase TrmO [Gemmiger sp.]|nr:tRNA (N6-threonylcarbamoyladenosine(37)-N6)-methyltransferase TrmO [Gemmiger sp.]